MAVIEDVSDVVRSNRLAAWAEMARIIAHEIKNPLTPIRLSVEHLREVWRRKSPDFERVLEECRKHGRDGARLGPRVVAPRAEHGVTSVPVTSGGRPSSTRNTTRVGVTPGGYVRGTLHPCVGMSTDGCTTWETER